MDQHLDTAEEFAGGAQYIGGPATRDSRGAARKDRHRTVLGAR
ncbi:hypothetical protein [Streptomyces sp. NPDC046261]